MKKDYYSILGLANSADDVVIRAAFKLLAQRYHPDKWQQEKDFAHQKMSAINEAYRHLSSLSHKPKPWFKPGGNDYYQLLGVLSNADTQMLHAVHEALKQKYRNSPKNLSEINLAYKTLSNNRLRMLYDFKQKAPVFLLGSNFSLWKVYLIYNLAFYLLIAILILIIWT